jgi:hypothetical protein
MNDSMVGVDGWQRLLTILPDSFIHALHSSFSCWVGFDVNVVFIHKIKISIIFFGKIISQKKRLASIYQSYRATSA